MYYLYYISKTPNMTEFVIPKSQNLVEPIDLSIFKDHVEQTLLKILDEVNKNK